jgi:hypothetical protein
MLRLFDPTQQFQDRSGALLVGGSVTVYLDGTDDLAEVYNDELHAMQQPVPIDSDGRVDGLFVKDDKTYWMKVKDPSGNTLFTITDMTPSSTPGSIDTILEKFVRVDASQTFTDAEKAKGRENLGIDQVLNNYVRVDAAQEFNDEKLKQGRDNIKAQKYVGGPGSFVDDTSVDQDNLWANIGSLDIAALGINDRYSNCFTNISLSLEVTVYNTGSADSEIVEHGRFNINVHAEPSNGKWIVDAGWAEYKGRGNTRLVELMRVSRNNGNGGAIDKITLYAKVPDPSTFYANAVNVSVLNNYGSIHKNDSLNSTKAIIAPWLLYLGIIIENLFGKNENVAPINKYVVSSYDSYVDYSTFSVAKFELLDTPQTDGNNAVKRGDLPVIVYEDGGGAVAWPIQVSDSGQHFSYINTNRSMSVFSGGPSGNILYLARLCSMGFMTPTIDTTTAGMYLVGEDYLYPMAGQTHSISVYFEVVDPGSSVYNVLATWRRLGTDDPKEFKIAVTYFGNTVGCWHGTKTLSATETALVVTDFGNMVRLEIDFISTDGERWYHFEYIKEANRSRMVEY